MIGLQVRRAHVDRRHCAQVAAVLCERAPPRVAQPARAHRRGIDVDDEQRLLEARRAREHRSLVVEDERVSVEDELVLAADRVAERDVGAVVACAGPEHLLAFAVAQEMKR